MRLCFVFERTAKAAAELCILPCSIDMRAVLSTSLSNFENLCFNPDSIAVVELKRMEKFKCIHHARDLVGYTCEPRPESAMASRMV